MKIGPYIAIASLFIALGSTLAVAAKIEVNFAPEPLIATRLQAGEVNQGKRQAAIQKLFEEAGCGPDPLTRAGKTSNVMCTLRGETESTIVVGAHFDFIDAGRGIVDDWSGTALLPSLFEALKTVPRKHTYVFIAFSDEERGLLGSARFVKHLSPDQTRAVQAFVNLECLGLAMPKVWLSRADRNLVRQLEIVAQSLDIKLEGVSVDAVGDDDSHPFLNAHIPVITIHSITQATLHILHTRADNAKAIDPGLYYQSYRLAAVYLAWLDQALPASN